ncbi:MAG: class I SAM-dependent methyltransferase [Chloroflexota bacterium]
MTAVPARLVWAIDTMEVAPDDRLLEIGCGAGLAVSLICERLIGGTITAIDQSAAMIARASRRNQACVAAGKAQFQVTAIEDAAFGDARFSKVFAINVGLFEREPAGALRVIGAHLLPGGALYLFHQPPLAEKTRPIAERVTRNLQANGFAVSSVIYQEFQPAPAVCVVAHPTT